MEYSLTIKTDNLAAIRKVVDKLASTEASALEPEPASVFQPQEIPINPMGDPICAECGHQFTPKRKDSRFCSKRCYMRNYLKTYKKAGPELNEKLREIKQTCPVPAKRPDFTHDFQY